jgi:hypothetical protein
LVRSKNQIKWILLIILTCTDVPSEQFQIMLHPQLLVFNTIAQLLILPYR